MTDTILSDSDRQNILNRAVAKYVKAGWATETITGTQAVLVKTKRIGLFWNVVLTAITAGVWLIYVAYRALNRKSTRIVLHVDEVGRVKRL